MGDNRGKNNEKKGGRAVRIAAIGAMALGIALLVTALILEARNVPWRLLFGLAAQNEEAVADPPPLELDGEDADASVVVVTPGPDGITVLPEVPGEPEEVILPGDEEDTAAAPPAPSYVVLGVFKIPALNVSRNLLEGAGKQMKYGVGHVPGTALPGQAGNCAVSGHRPFPFRYLDRLVAGDSVVVKSGDITWTYTVYESFEVLPDEVWVLRPIRGEDYALTIITCTPYMVSSHRLIVRARLTDINGQTPAEYYGTPGGTAQADGPADATDGPSAGPAWIEDGDSTASPPPDGDTDATDATGTPDVADTPDIPAPPDAADTPDIPAPPDAADAPAEQGGVGPETAPPAA